MQPMIHTTIDLSILSRDLDTVRKELGAAGLYDSAMRNVDVELVPYNSAEGFRCWSGNGNIAIPEVAMGVLRELFQRNSLTLQDMLRHCYGHTYAEIHREQISSDAFDKAFGDHYYSGIAWSYDPSLHITTYAANGPAEDFAEVFAEYVSRNGKLPQRLDKGAIRKKWAFISSLRTE